MGRQLKRAAMMAELTRTQKLLVPEDAETYRHAPPGIHPDPEAVYEEILQANPADPSVFWLRKAGDDKSPFFGFACAEIELMRKLQRHARELSRTPGVTGFGIGPGYFRITLDSGQGSPQLPTELEGILVVVEERGTPRFSGREER